MDKKDIMSYEPVLPADFDGTFRFTNWTDEDFAAKWGGKEYRFPAQSTSAMVMTNQTPLEIQQIRKKFAKDLAQRELGKTPEYAKLIAQEKNTDGSPRLNSIHMAAAYSLDVLAPLIQKCLEPLPIGKVNIVEAEKAPLEDKLSRSEDGTLNTEAIDRKISLKDKALKA